MIDEQILERAHEQRLTSDTSAEAAARVEVVPLLVFRVANVVLACGTDAVQTITDWQPPTPLPRVPDHVLGLLLQGENVVPVVDVAQVLQLGRTSSVSTSDDSSLHRVIFIQQKDMHVGLLSEKVFGIVESPAQAFKEPGILKGDGLRSVLAVEVETPHGLAGVVDLGALVEKARVKD